MFETENRKHKGQKKRLNHPVPGRPSQAGPTRSIPQRAARQPPIFFLLFCFSSLGRPSQPGPNRPAQRPSRLHRVDEQFLYVSDSHGHHLFPLLFSINWVTVPVCFQHENYSLLNHGPIQGSYFPLPSLNPPYGRDEPNAMHRHSSPDQPPQYV